MKRTVQLGKLGANLPYPKGQRKNKHVFHELQLQRRAQITPKQIVEAFDIKDDINE